MGFPPVELPVGQVRALPVLTACHPTEKGVRACTTDTFLFRLEV